MKIRFGTANFVAILLTISLISCKDKSRDHELKETTTPSIPVVEVVTTGMDFQLENEIAAGWTTFRYVNNSEEPHFFILEKMPEGLGLREYREELIPPFMAAFQAFENGEMEEGMKALEKTPEWFNAVELGGGVGIISPKSITESTVYLNPGTYVMECYIRMPNGLAHAFLGMTEEVIVIPSNNDRQPPKADYKIDVSSKTGVTFVDSLTAGKYTFEVNFEDQIKYEHMLGHDINLIRMDHDSLLSQLNHWLNTVDIKAFRTPAPEGIRFLGGVQDLPEKTTGFFTANLEEGNYVLISEIPNSVERNMFKLFRVH